MTWVNLQAFRWAYEQELGVTAKAVLITFAIHANERGYTWPSMQTIAAKWRMDRETVARQTKILLGRRMICLTRKRYGATGQVKVYRLPRIAYASHGKSRTFGNPESVAKVRPKRGKSRGKSCTNKRKDKHTEQKEEFIALWREAYQEAFGYEYAFQEGRDDKLAEMLLKSTELAPAELIHLVKRAWANDGFYSQQAVSIGGLNRVFNEVRHEVGWMDYCEPSV